MKKWIFALVFLLSASAFAQLEQVCRQTVIPLSSGAGMSYVLNRPMFAFAGSQLLVAQRHYDDIKTYYTISRVSAETQEVFYETGDRIIGLEVANGSLWVLLEYSVLELNLAGEVQAYYDLRNERARARGMTQAGGALYIASGPEGLIKFDLTTKTTVWRTWFDELTRNERHRVLPVGAAADATGIYITLAGATEMSFNGAAKIDPETGRVIHTAEYDRGRAGVIDHYPYTRMIGGHLVINNGGWIHILRPTMFNSRSTIRPRWAAVQVDRGYAQYMMLEGDFFADVNGRLNGCGSFHGLMDDGRPIRQSDYFNIDLKL